MLPNIGEIVINNFNDTQIEKETEILDNLILRRDFETVIKDKELFWLLYCKAISQKGKIEYLHLKMNVHQKNIEIIGNSIVIHAFRKAIDELQTLFEKNYVNKSFTLQVIHFDQWNNTYINDTDQSDILANSSKIRLIHDEYPFIFQPVFPYFCQLINANCTVSEKRIFASENSEELEERISTLFTVTWNKEHFIYPIQPVALSDGQELKILMYSLYKNKNGCDFSIIGKNGKIELHKVLLLCKGGEAIQALLNSEINKEGANQINLNAYSLTTLEYFVDFLYLGEEVLKPNNIADKELVITELLDLGKCFLLDDLVNCCTNLLTLTAEEKHKKIILDLAILYENDHLRALADHFDKIPEKNNNEN